MADIRYTAGRGRGVLGLERHLSAENNQSSLSKKFENFSHKDESANVTSTKKLLVVYDYQANPDKPGGFSELTITKGEILEFIGEHADNEHWWEAMNKQGDTGYVPSSYVIVKEDQVLPWLEQSMLMAREQERKERAHRNTQQNDFSKGLGFGIPPTKVDKPYTYVSAYNRQPANKKSSTESYYCEVCGKGFNGPYPYKAHMSSKGHKEALELEEQYGNNN